MENGEWIMESDCVAMDNGGWMRRKEECGNWA